VKPDPPFVRLQREAVAGTPSGEAITIRPQGGPEFGHVDVQSVARCVRNSPGPEILQQSVGGDDLTGVDEETGEQNPLAGRPEINLCSIPENLKSPKDSYVHIRDSGHSKATRKLRRWRNHFDCVRRR